MPDRLRRSLVLAMGGGQPKLRDVVYIRSCDYDKATLGMQILTADGDTVGTMRQPTPIELGHSAMVRRIARLRLGLPAVQHVASTVVAGSTTGASSTMPAASEPLRSNGIVETKVKLSSIVDPSLDTDLVRLPHADIRNMYRQYEALRGAEPATEIEPTVEQISAIAQLVKSDMAPYADFALFGPHGRRLLHKLSYLSYTFMPDGSWQRRELPGPPSFDHWWTSFWVLRTTYLLLGLAPSEAIDNYGELIRGFSSIYGAGAWFIYAADVRMRVEQFDRLRRHAERSEGFDVARPWFAIFGDAIADRLWWDENLHRPCILYLTRVRTAGETVFDGTVQPALDRPTLTRNEESSRRRRSRSNHPRNGGQKPRSSGGSGTFTKGGKRYCDAYNSEGGCTVSNCDKVHACKTCRRLGHSMLECLDLDRT